MSLVCFLHPWTQWFQGILKEMMFLAWDCHKSKGSSSVQPDFPLALFSHRQPAIMHSLNDIATARTAAATVQELCWSSLQKSEIQWFGNVSLLMLSCYLYLTHMLLKPKGKALAVPWGTSAHKEKGWRCILSISAFTSDSLPRWPILRGCGQIRRDWWYCALLLKQIRGALSTA